VKEGHAKATPTSKDSFAVATRLRIEKSFSFQKTNSGDWRCSSTALQPIQAGVSSSGP
jgi:hypothetical protein